MEDFEKLGTFYLGRGYDLAGRTLKDDLLLYDSKDLVTHAVCVGMTGSGKTGLCISLLEEAALDGVPAIIIDPKGDMTNLMLTFPELRKEDFLPWVNLEDAQKKGMSPEDYAAKQADTWKNGLASWGQDGSRIARMRQSCDISIYTPGSNAGVPVSVLRSFDAPPPEVVGDEELLQERINTTVTSLLGLIGVEGDPIRSKEHILISTIISGSWSRGEPLDLAALIQSIQSPPVKQVGVLDIDSFYPPKERFELAMRLNNLLAAPGFKLWMEGEPMDVERFLHTPAGKPRLSIFSIAHLSDAERMFFVSMLLNHVVGWMRTQSGTTSLRAIMYIDEVFGYLPPVANPPSKLPLLTLMKQARAFGLGVTLVTQNPVDLDYKSLSNAGTWFIGRLQTDRDKVRILDALEGASAGSGQKFDRAQMDQNIAGLGNRVFLMHNVNDDAPTIFQTRWAMSYLRGPLTREQIKRLMEPVKSAVSSATTIPAVKAAERAPAGAALRQRPVLPPEVPQYFLPPADRSKLPASYVPMVMGVAQVRFADTRRKVDETRELSFLAPIGEGVAALDWERSRRTDLPLSELASAPLEGVPFASLPAAAAKPKSYAAWQKDLAGWLARSQGLELLYCPSLQQYSRPGEREADFRIRMQLASRELKDLEMDKLRKKYVPKYAAIDERIRKAEIAREKEKDQVKRQRYQSAVSLGSSILGAVVGRKVGTAASRTARDYGKAQKEKQDVEFAEENLEVLLDRKKKLEEEFQTEIREMGAKADPLTEKLETVPIKPTKTNISVKLVALVWSAEA